MRGEQFLIIQKILKEGNSPVKEAIDGITPERILQVTLDEYWKEWRYKLDYNAANCIITRNLGSFYTSLSPLKGYIRTIIKRIRKLRQNIVRLSKNPDWVKEESKTWIMERVLTRKLGIAWKQLDERRELMIMRYLRYNDRLRKKGEAHRIKYNYEWYPYKFLEAYGYNSNIFKEIVVNQ